MELAINKLPNYKRIICLVSSGVDSIAGAHYFIKKVSKFYRIEAATLHFNHQQRDQNDEMEFNYNKFNRGEDIAAWGSTKLGAFIRSKTEDGLRKARIEYIKLHWDDTIFITFHHLNDCVESYLLNCLRGKEGYLPVPFYTEVGTNIICHPFLETKKENFIKYAERNDLNKYVVNDETNEQVKGSRRNFLRKDIIPLLEREKVGMETIVKKKMKERLLLEIIKQ